MHYLERLHVFRSEHHTESDPKHWPNKHKKLQKKLFFVDFLADERSRIR
jgi:hypothetical protein